MLSFSDVSNRNILIATWEFKYNDKSLTCCGRLDSTDSEFIFYHSQIKITDTFSFVFEPDAVWNEEHTTKIFLSSTKHSVLVSSVQSEIYPLSAGKFAATRLKKISDSLKEKVFEVHVFIDTLQKKPFVIARLRLSDNHK